MELVEFSLEQRRRAIDIQQAYEAWRDTNVEFRRSRGSMRWKQSHGRDYLYYRKYGGVERSRGPRSEETERLEREFREHRDRLRDRLTTIDARLNDMARVNRAMGLGRVPAMASRILRRLDAEGLLGRHLMVVGTHAMFAYEAAAGVFFSSVLTATEDLDLLWDVRRRLRLALVDAQATGVLGLLKQVDRSFTAPKGHFRAVNDAGYYVDLIRPLEKDEMRTLVSRVGDADDDLVAAALEGLEWLISAPKFERIVVGADGLPLFMSCADPRVFALHKHWLSRQRNNVLKRPRDAAQARAVAHVASQYLGLSFDKHQLASVPDSLLREAPALLAA